MIWQENTKVIVMITKEVERGKNKCAKYWPDAVSGEVKEFGRLRVKTLLEKPFPDFTLHEFQVTDSKTDDTRIVHHYYFTAWPDHGVPSDPGCVLNFLQEVNLKQDSVQPAGPIVVHCRLVIISGCLLVDYLSNRLLDFLLVLASEEQEHSLSSTRSLIKSRSRDCLVRLTFNEVFNYFEVKGQEWFRQKPSTSLYTWQLNILSKYNNRD